jgi:hypothetical protein
MFPGKGQPPALTNELKELVVLTYGAIEAANVERWALAFGAAAPPVLPGTMRVSSYETDVVGTIHRLGQRYWERRGEAAVWERPFPTGEQGRPKAVDIALFDTTGQRETRIEFGLYTKNNAGHATKKKLEDDAEKLAGLVGTVAPGYPNVENYIVLWHEMRGASVKMTNARRLAIRKAFRTHAETITAAAVHNVDLLLMSAGPLFPDRDGEHHWAAVGLFKVTI